MTELLAELMAPLAATSRPARRPKSGKLSQVYASENAIQPEVTERHFHDLDEVKAYVDKLVKSAWFKRRYYKYQQSEAYRDSFWTRNGGIEVMYNVGGGGSHANYRGRRIRLNRTYHMRELVVLHELAHLITEHIYDRPAHHGREFCRTLLELVRHQMGDDAYRKLKAQYVKRKVKHSLPRKLSPEQREAAVERARWAREAKAFHAETVREMGQ